MNETNEQQSLDLLSSEQLGEALEAVLFASGYPLSFEKLAQTFQKTEKEMRCFAEEYAKAYNQSSRGILFLILDDSCQLCSKEEYKEYIRTAMGIPPICEAAAAPRSSAPRQSTTATPTTARTG